MDTGAEHPVPASAREKRVSAALVATAALLGISRVWVGGYSFGAADHSWQVPLVRGMAASAVMKDYIFNPPQVLSFFFPLAAIFARFFSVESVYFAGYVHASIFTSVGLYLVARIMLSSRPAAIIAVILLMIGKDVAAGATTWDAMFLPRTAAMPLMLFAWWHILRSRPTPAGVFMGLAFALHPLTAVYGSAVVFLSMLFAEGRLYMAACKFSLGAAVPVIITVLYAGSSSMPLFSAPAAWYEAMVMRNIHHLTYDNFLQLAALLAFAVFSAAHVGLSGGRSRLLLGATAASAFAFMYVSLGQVAGYLLDLHFREIALMKPPAIALLQPLRVSGPFGILVLVAVAGMIWRSMQKGLVARLAAAAALAALMWCHYVAGALFLAAALFAQNDSRIERGISVALAIAALAGTALYRQTLLIIISAVLTASVLAAFTTRNTRVSSAAATLVATVVLLGLVPSGWAQRACERTFGSRGAFADQRYSEPIDLHVVGEPALIEAADWINRNTEKDDVCMVPPWWESFRVASDRPVYGLYKDGTLVFFDAQLGEEWLSRMGALHVPRRPGAGSRMSESDKLSYEFLNAQTLREALSIHPANYVVRTSEDLDTLEAVYRGKNCFIYEFSTGRERQ